MLKVIQEESGFVRDYTECPEYGGSPGDSVVYARWALSGLTAPEVAARWHASGS
jgi:hypothetical protein